MEVQVLFSAQNIFCPSGRIHFVSRRGLESRRCDGAEAGLRTKSVDFDSKPSPPEKIHII
jgi:hypothetical protein